MPEEQDAAMQEMFHRVEQIKAAIRFDELLAEDFLFLTGASHVDVEECKSRIVRNVNLRFRNSVVGG
jgi:hypothetical protein